MSAPQSKSRRRLKTEGVNICKGDERSCVEARRGVPDSVPGKFNGVTATLFGFEGK